MIRSLLFVACALWPTVTLAEDHPNRDAGPEVARCVEEARNAARRVRFDIDRAKSWEAVAQVQARAGDGAGMRASFAEARRAVGADSDTWYRPQGYEELAWAQWRSGEKDGARQTLARAVRELGGINYFRVEFFWVYRLARDQSQMADTPAAEKTWELARKMKRQGSGLDGFDISWFAAALAEASKFDEARAVAEEIKENSGASNAWEGIALAYIAIGDLKAAEAVVPKMDLGDGQRIIAKIAEIRFRAGNAQAVKALATGKRQDLWASEAWVTVVREKLKGGDVAGATGAAGVIEEASDRVTALAAIAAQLVKRGDTDKARKMAAEAARVALEVDFPDHIGEVFCTAARAQALSGDISGARQSLERVRLTAEKLDEKDWRSDAPRKWEMLRRVAEAQAGMGDFEAAEKTIEKMERDLNDRERAEGSRAVARLLVQAKGFEEAGRWARTVSPEMVKCYAWVGAAEGLIDRK